MSVNLNRSLAIPPAEEKPCDLYDRCASWDLVPRAVSSFLSYSRSANLLVMCAEPGVGKTFALRSLVGSNSQTSASHLLRLRGVDPALVSKRLSRLTRQVERERLSGKEVYVGLDDVPPGDDLDVDRDVSLILRMVTAGAVVAVSVLPENELLAERLSGAIYVLSRDMLVTDILELGPSDPLYDARSLTGGIPSLAIALLRDNGGSHLDRLVAGSTYFETLGRLVGATLRSGLLDDELSVRLAMILLGRGTFEDVAGVTCVNPSEVAMGLERFAPMLGVSCHDASFRCYGVDTLDGLSASAPALSPKASAWRPVFDAVIGVLVDRGEYARAALVARIAPSATAIATVVGRSEDFVCAGEVGLVRRMLGPAQAQSLVATETAECARSVLSALGDRGYRLSGAWLWPQSDDSLPHTGTQNLGALLVGCRAVLAGERISVPSGGTGQSEGLAVHLQAVQLLRDGRPGAVQRIVGQYVFSSPEDSLASALLRLDASIARVLLGDQAEKDDSHPDTSGFLEREGFSAIRDESTFLLALDALAHGSSDLASMDVLMNEAERAGNELIRVATLVMCAAAAYLMSDYRGARMRSAIAAAAAGRANFSHLEAEASVLCKAAAGAGTGGEGYPPDWEDICDTEGLSVIARMVRLASEGSDSSPEGLRMLEDAAAPSDEAWLLRVLVSGEGDFAQRMSALVPRAWMPAMKPIDVGKQAGGSVMKPRRDLPSSGSEDEPSEPDACPRLRLCLLGGFSLYADGEPVPEWRIERRSAKAMLVFVALHPKLSVKRFEIVEQLWPDCDYKAGLERIYQATSTIRREVGAVARGVDPFLSGWGDKSVSLNPALFECDFVEFADAANKALASEGEDVQTLEAALRAEKLYSGDLFVPTRDVSGYVVSRRLEFRELYADTMVVGAEAALRLQRYRIAARLADEATTADDLREDAVEVLIQALRASGRVFEAEQRYKRYAARFADRTHMPPPKRLRRAAGEGFREEDGSGNLQDGTLAS